MRPGVSVFRVHLDRLLPFRRETPEANQPRLPRCGLVPRRGARLTSWLARTSRVRAQHLQHGEGRGVRRRRVRGAANVFHDITDLIGSQLADEHPQFFEIDHGTCKSIFLQQVQRRGARAMLCTAGRPNSCPAAAGTSFRIPTNPVQRRPRRPMRTTRRRTPFTTTPTPLAMGGRPLERAPCRGFSC